MTYNQTVGIMFSVILVCFLLVHYSVTSDKENKQLCENKNGIYIEARNGDGFCVRKNTVIFVFK